MQIKHLVLVLLVPLEWNPVPIGGQIDCSYIRKPEEGWYGQLNYCYEKGIHVVIISFVVVFTLSLFCSL